MVLCIAVGTLLACSEPLPGELSDPTDATSADLSSTAQIYRDRLGSGWLDYSSASRNLANGSPVYSGSRSIAVQYAPGSALDFRHSTGASTSGYGSLDLAVNAGANGGAALSVVATSGGKAGPRVLLASYCDGGALKPNAWVRCRLPLSALGVTGPRLQGVVFQEAAGASLKPMYLDVIALAAGSSTPTPTPPPAPSGLVATASTGAVGLSWSSVSGATGYSVYRASSATGAWASITATPVTSTSFQDAAVSAGSTYWYAVSATNSAGEGAKSSAASATVPAAPPPPPSLPAAPTGLSAAAAASSVTLSWASTSGATGYSVYRATSQGGAWFAVTPALLTATSFQDNAVSAGSTYWYAVSASNSAGEGPKSATASATVPAATPATTWIYRDALASPWADWSWAPRTLTSTSPVYAGSYAISSAMGAWQGLYFSHSAGFVPESGASLVLQVHGGSGGAGAALQVRALVNGAWTDGTDLGAACTGGSIRANAWTACQVPLSAIAPAGALVTGLSIQEWRGLSLPAISFDEVGLRAGSGTTPPPPPPPAISVAIAPSSASLTFGQSQAFTATVSGTTNLAVTWSVAEGSSGGSVSTSGTYTAPQSSGTFHVVATSSADATKSATATVTVSAPSTPPPPPPSGGSSLWVGGYWAAWQAGLYPANRIDFSAIAHLFLAPGVWASNPLQYHGSLTASLAASLSAQAHAAGRKTILMVGGSDDSYFQTSAQAANRATLVANLLAALNATGADGIDLDWEINVNASDLIALARDLRAARPGMVLTAAVGWDTRTRTDWGATLAAGLAPYVDQINIMSYGMEQGGGWASWFLGPLDGASMSPTIHPSSIKQAVAAMTGAGVPAAKIGLGIGFFGHGWNGPTGPLQAQGSMVAGEDPYSTILQQLFLPSTYRFFNPATGDGAGAASPYLTLSPAIGSRTYETYEDEASIAAKGAWARSVGLGGCILWTVNEGCTDAASGRNPLLDAVRQAFLAKGPPATRLLASGTGYVSGGAASITVSLPATKAALVTWSNDDTYNFDLQASGDQYGKPTAYVLEAYNGASWLTLTSVTNNGYHGRQHVLDLTGYSQLRMRVTAANGNGNLALEVRDAPVTADSWLFLGDSITANTWKRGDWSSAIHAQRSNEPAATNGGIGGWLSGTPLRTTDYGGIPTIRKWLQDSPAKYVALSFGTNDAMQGVSASAYYANMERLVKEVIAAGKTPVVPTIVYSPNAAVQANAPALNAQLKTLKANYPAVVSGPDLWTRFYGRTQAQGWYYDDLHPSLTTGAADLKAAWAEAMLAGVYLP
ncbi:MAG: glycosyl hydrolase family 18 protein [Myxococcales bacterium]